MDTKARTYDHDCLKCEFLGTVICQDEIFDLYFHDGENTRVFTTIIARFGSDGPEYASGLIFGLMANTLNSPIPYMQALGIAYDKCVKMGKIRMGDK